MRISDWSSDVCSSDLDGVADGVIEGLYRWDTAPDGLQHPATILFSGTANLAAREAQQQLAEHYGVGAELHSATSYKRLREQALSTERWTRLHPDQPARTRPGERRVGTEWVTTCTSRGTADH